MIITFFHTWKLEHISKEARTYVQCTCTSKLLLRINSKTVLINPTIFYWYVPPLASSEDQLMLAVIIYWLACMYLDIVIIYRFAWMHVLRYHGYRYEQFAGHLNRVYYVYKWGVYIWITSKYEDICSTFFTFFCCTSMKVLSLCK